MSHRLRWTVMAVLLAAAAWLAWFGDKTPQGATARVSPPAPAPGLAAVAARVQVAPGSRPVAAPIAIEALLPRVEQAGEVGAPVADLFSTAAWRAAPVPPPAVLATATVVGPTPAPPQPYRLIGKKFEADAWEVFLGRGDTSFIARGGDTLEGEWRVERVEPPTLTLIHLASGQKQTLDIGVAP